jgi:hypothetical protein
MALRGIPYDRLEPLLRAHLSTKEDAPTARLIQELRAARGRGYLTPSELTAVCYWKSPRAIRHVQANSRNAVRSATCVALGTRSEETRLKALTGLRGVSIPMASAILTLLYPHRYGVVDIRVWQLLHRLGAVKTNAAGIGFSSRNWHQFLAIIRHLATKLQIKARDVERTLFDVHKAYQAGRLYKS